MTESIETPEVAEGIDVPFTDEEIKDFIDGGVPSFHTVLEVWREVLKPAADEAVKKVTPQYANRITSEYRELAFADMNDFRDSYFAKIAELQEILATEIASDVECLTWATPEEDVENNTSHYLNLLTQWQLAVLGWEIAWECTNADAAIEIAAISEVHKMFFGPTGLTAFLDNIKFEFTEADSAELARVLNDFRGGADE